jgi:hypothetical protein
MLCSTGYGPLRNQPKKLRIPMADRLQKTPAMSCDSEQKQYHSKTKRKITACETHIVIQHVKISLWGRSAKCRSIT